MFALIFVIYWIGIFAPIAESVTLDMNCTQEGLTGTACINYMRNYLNNYIFVDHSYNSKSLPVESPYWHETPPSESCDFDVLDVDCLVTFKDLLDVDTVAGTIAASIYLDMYWKDALISWNPVWTDQVDFLDIPPDLLWFPDIQLYNAVGNQASQFNQPAVFLSSDGSVWWSAKGLVTYTCTFDTRRFPFDKHKCHAKFGSWIYAIYQLNIVNVSVVRDHSFENLAWAVTEVSSHRQVELQWEVYNFSFAIYTLGLERYHEHYVATAVVPSVIVTCISLLALWSNTIESRLALGVTGLLTIIAVQWTVSRELPVSKDSTWLGRFSNICMAFVAMVCLECYLSGYMLRKKKKEAPLWILCMVKASLWHLYVKEMVLYMCRKKMSFPSGESSDMTVEMGTSPLSGRSGGPERDSAEQEGHATTSILRSADDDIDDDWVGVNATSVTWERGSRAFDRICRLVLPVSYAVLICVLFAGEL